jgi:MFS family permease
LNISIFLPSYRATFHPSIGDGEIGIILSYDSELLLNHCRMFQVAYLVASMIMGAILQKIGRKNAIVIGYILIVSATVGFGLLTYVENE